MIVADVPNIHSMITSKIMSDSVKCYFRGRHLSVLIFSPPGAVFFFQPGMPLNLESRRDLGGANCKRREGVSAEDAKVRRELEGVSQRG